MNSNSEDYKRGYEAGRQAMKLEIANNPILLFEIVTTMAKSAQEKLDTYKGELSDKQKGFINDALAGKITHDELRKMINNA